MMLFSILLCGILLSFIMSNAELGGVVRHYTCQDCSPYTYIENETSAPTCTKCKKLMTECSPN